LASKKARKNLPRAARSGRFRDRALRSVVFGFLVIIVVAIVIVVAVPVVEVVVKVIVIEIIVVVKIVVVEIVEIVVVEIVVVEIVIIQVVVRDLSLPLFLVVILLVVILLFVFLFFFVLFVPAPGQGHEDRRALQFPPRDFHFGPPSFQGATEHHTFLNIEKVSERGSCFLVTIGQSDRELWTRQDIFPAAVACFPFDPVFGARQDPSTEPIGAMRASVGVSVLLHS
jgi:hypothetical protein